MEKIKYLSQWDGSDETYLKFIHGSRTQHRTWFIKNRFNLYDSKWYSGEYASNKIKFYLGVQASVNQPADLFSIEAASQNVFALINSDLDEVPTDWGQELKLGESHTWSTVSSWNGISSPFSLMGIDKIKTLDFRTGVGKHSFGNIIFDEDGTGWTKNKGVMITRLLYGISDEFRKSITLRFTNVSGNPVVIEGVTVNPGEYYDTTNDISTPAGCTVETLGITRCGVFGFGGLNTLTSLEEIDIRNVFNDEPKNHLNDLNISDLVNLHIYRAIGSSITSFNPAEGVVLNEVSLPNATSFGHRDSKLTHLLKDSLGGNAKTCIIANISPANGSIQETISTLIFAQSAKMIKNKAIVNEEYANSLISGGPISAKASFEEVKKLREKYNAVKAENFYLLSLLEGSDYKGYNQFGMNSKGNNEFTKTIDCVEEEIENMLNEISNKEAAMNELINKKERMKKQYDDIEIELKIKDKMLQEKKSVLNLNKKEYDVVKNQLKKNVLENAYQTKSLNTFEKDKIKLSEEHKEKLNELNKVITGQNNLIITKNNIIKSTLEDISEISEVIESQRGVIRTKTLQEEKIIKEKGELDKEIERQEEDINRLNSEISEISAELSKLNDVLANTKNELIEAKQKCKTFINDLSGKIQLLQLKRIEVEEKKNAALKEVEYSNLEFEKLQQGIEERKNQIQVINVGKIKHLEEEKENRLEEKREAETKLKAAKERNIKLNDEFDVLSENKNIYSNKISLLTKLKNENTKLRNELIQYKSKVDDLKIRFNAKGTQIDIASLTTQKENQLKESERMILKVINRMKNEYNKRNNYATENLFDEEHRDLKDTFNYYFEKVLDIKKENELILKQKEEENQKADKQIASLNRELQNLKEAGSNKCSIEVKVSRRTLSRIDTNIISPFGKKRKFNEFMPINGDSL